MHVYTLSFVTWQGCATGALRLRCKHICSWQLPAACTALLISDEQQLNGTALYCLHAAGHGAPTAKEEAAAAATAPAIQDKVQQRAAAWLLHAAQRCKCWGSVIGLT